MERRILWRATDSGYCGTWSCWAEDREDAEAYQDNPGFGGETLYQVDVEVDWPTVLDLAGLKDLDALRLVAEIADLDEEWVEDAFRSTAYAYEAIEGRNKLRKAFVEAGYLWIRYMDSYPYDCRTWVYIGEEPLNGQEVA